MVTMHPCPGRLGASRQWERALDLFLACQMAGAEATKGVCLALLSALEVSAQPRPALQVRACLQGTAGCLALMGASLISFAPCNVRAVLALLDVPWRSCTGLDGIS